MKKIQFYLRFHTQFGQTLFIRHGNSEALPLHYLDEQFWTIVLEIESGTKKSIRYSYYLKNADGTIVEEWGDDREVDISFATIDEFRVIDTWNHAGEFQNAFYTAPFQEVLLNGNRSSSKAKATRHCTHIFKVKYPLLRKNEVLCMSGNGDELGNWNSDAVVPMSFEGKWWVLRLNLHPKTFPLNYKYGVYNTKHKKFVEFESGENRILQDDFSVPQITFVHDGFAYLPNNSWKGAGVALPVFSLRSKNSFGVGEFSDLKLFTDWAKKAGLHLIQILPINDTTATYTHTDSYPYAAISAFALNPIYLNLEKVAGKKYADLVKPLRKKQKQLNELPDVDHLQVMSFKTSVIKELYLAQKDEFFKDEYYQKYFDKHKEWLIPYAAFCYLRDRNKTADFTQWKIYSKYDKSAIEKYVSPKAKHFDEIGAIYFAQYHLHLQLKDAVDYAHKNGIVLKGDIPIGIYRHSCDAWMDPSLYHMELQAGAPPDDFAIRGQNWGFPTYNWQKMEQDGFSWWKSRFEQMSDYFDAFRIDHVLGFFRIWSIPMNAVEGIMGYFDPAIPVHVNEFAERGIWFDHYRYTHPYINEAVLWEMFGPNHTKLKPYLESIGNGHYRLKEGFVTQKEVEEHFAQKPETDDNTHIKQGLFDLISNVILFEVPESQGTQFHFRFAIEETSNFRYLDQHTKDRLKDLYINYFFRRQDAFWYKEAMNKLPALKKATNMLVCGEDLGMVPHCVPDVMKQLGILSLEIQRMPKEPNKEFFHPKDAPYLSVVTPSTHDMSTVRGWWQESRSKTQRFYNNELGHPGEAPKTCEPWINKAIVLQHLYSPAMWSIFLLQDILGMSEKLRRENPQEERINIPADSKHFWKYRMHIYLEDLLKEKEFNDELHEYVRASGRK